VFKPNPVKHILFQDSASAARTFRTKSAGCVLANSAPIFASRSFLQTMMKTISLDGTWDFLHSSPERQPRPIEIRQIKVPSPWQAQFDDLRMKAGIGIYRRWIEIPAGWREGGRIFLRFGAVFHHTRAWVNGISVGAHEGGFLPFSFDITEQLVEGRNEIKVRAESPTDNPAAFPEAPFAEIPFGKQSWYGPLSGIWQSVRLELRDVDHFDRLRVIADPATGRVDVRGFFHTPLMRAAQIAFTVTNPSGETAASIVLEAPAAMEEIAAQLQIRDPALWSPDEPNLYTVQAALGRRGEILDQISQSFGFRSIETRDGRFYLNGKLLYLRAALDQDYYPDTICTVPSVEFLEDQLRKAKELGLNCLRCHIKAADPRYYEVADRLGMLVWTEVPNGGLSTERSRARKEGLLKGIVDRDRHHPSIIIWTIINENWGVDLVHDVEHRSWLKRTYHWLKTYDPTRLVVDNSPLWPSFHVQTDIADYHHYAAIPESRESWDDFVERLASRTPSLFSPEGDAVVSGQEPVMCSEFGNWGLPDPEGLKDADGREPWWFETGHDWGEGVMYPHGVENRFTDWSLDRVFGSLGDFAKAAQWQQFRALKYQIEAMRRKPQLAGYAITELTDVHWESNGLLDMRRNPRVFHDVFHHINADTVILPRADATSYWAGGKAQIEIAIAHGGGEPLSNARLELSFGEGTVARELPVIAPGEVLNLPAAELTMPDLSRSANQRAVFRLNGADGALIATNTLDFSVLTAAASAAKRSRAWSPERDIGERLEALGYNLAPSLDVADFAVARRHDSEMAAYVRDGGHLLLCPEEDMSLHPFFPHWQDVRIRGRAGTLWQGDWASSFSWLDRSGVFADLPGGPMIDMSFAPILPRHVIGGCNLLDFQARVHAGIVVGWIHKAAALLVQRAYGKGRMAATTFRLFDAAAAADPVATVLTQRLIDLTLTTSAASEVQAEMDFEPGLGMTMARSR
jgi:hypothetical protein